MPQIVQINISATNAPVPITLQSMGAMVSQGATTLASNSYSIITQASDLTPLLSVPLALGSLVWSGGTVVATTSAPIPGRNVSDVFITTIAGTTPAAYSGTYLVTMTGASTFSYALIANPGSETVAGTYTTPGQSELISMMTTFFAQGTSQSVYVLELGAGNQTTGPALLGTWRTANPGIFYLYLLPSCWDASSGLLTLAASYESLSSMTYFFVTTTAFTFSSYSKLMKCIFALVEPYPIPFTEFSIAAAFQRALAYRPSSSNRMTPFAFSYLFGVTAYPTQGTQVFLNALKTANINYVGTGAEGGISNTILLWGKTLDGNDFTYWYSVDWIQLQADQAISNAVINGSNNPLAPLYYNQNGINTLQDAIVLTVQNAITFGLANGTVGRAALDGPVFANNLNLGAYPNMDIVNAVPFLIYTKENPSAYATGTYGGLSVVYIPQRGFTQIIFNIQVTSFVSQ